MAADLDLNLINIAAEPFAVSKSVGADDSTEFSALFIDIGGGSGPEIETIRSYFFLSPGIFSNLDNGPI